MSRSSMSTPSSANTRAQCRGVARVSSRKDRGLDTAVKAPHVNHPAHATDYHGACGLPLCIF